MRLENVPINVSCCRTISFALHYVFPCITPFSLIYPPLFLTAYETSCFSGTYVTGESINDDYFAKLHDLRNDDAKLKQLESTGAAQVAKAGMPPGSHDGCENLQNDRRGAARA